MRRVHKPVEQVHLLSREGEAIARATVIEGQHGVYSSGGVCVLDDPGTVPALRDDPDADESEPG